MPDARGCRRWIHPESSGRFLPRNPKPTEAPMSGKHLRQAVGEDTVMPLKPVFKDSETYPCNDSEPNYLSYVDILVEE